MKKKNSLKMVQTSRLFNTRFKNSEEVLAPWEQNIKK